MHFQSYLPAIGHHSHIGGDNGRNARFVGGIANLMHRRDILTIDDGIHREIGLHSVLITGGCYFPQIVNREMIGRM